MTEYIVLILVCILLMTCTCVSGVGIYANRQSVKEVLGTEKDTVELATRETVDVQNRNPANMQNPNTVFYHDQISHVQEQLSLMNQINAAQLQNSQNRLLYEQMNVPHAHTSDVVHYPRSQPGPSAAAYAQGPTPTVATFKPTSTPKLTSIPKPKPTPAPTSTPKPTSTPAPTSTPKPTPTPKPTSTPKPTPTPTSTPAPTPIQVSSLSFKWENDKLVITKDGSGKHIISEKTDWDHGHDCFPRKREASSWHDNVGGIVGLRLENNGDKADNAWFSIPDGAPNMFVGKKTRNKPEWDASGGLRCLDGWEMFVHEKGESGIFYLRTQRGNFSKQDAQGYTRPYLSKKENKVYTSTNKDDALRFKRTILTGSQAMFTIVN